MAISRKAFLQMGISSVLSIGAAGLLHLPATALPPARRRRLRIALLSDGHFGQKGTDYVQFHEDMYQWIQLEKSRGLDAVIFNGDLFHDDPSVVLTLKLWLQRLEVPWYASHGNHDRIPEPEWQQLTGQPYNYVVHKRRDVFIFLNTADAAGKYIQEPTDWMAAQLQDNRKAANLFVVMHITPFSWTGAGHPHPDMVALLNAQPNLRAIFHGHDHEEDGYKIHEGKPYFFDGHTGGSWGVPYRGYRILEVFKDNTIYTYQVNPASVAPVNVYGKGM